MSKSRTSCLKRQHSTEHTQRNTTGLPKASAQRSWYQAEPRADKPNALPRPHRLWPQQTMPEQPKKKPETRREARKAAKRFMIGVWKHNPITGGRGVPEPRLFRTSP